MVPILVGSRQLNLRQLLVLYLLRVDIIYLFRFFINDGKHPRRVCLSVEDMLVKLQKEEMVTS